MDWIRKLERKFGRYAIPGIVNYLVAGQVFIFLAMFFVNASVPSLITLTRGALLQGQIWRLITFVWVPMSTSILWFALSAYLYYFIGMLLEGAWGTFRLNLYLLLGVLGSIASALVVGFGTNQYILLSLFLAYAILYPEREVLLFFCIPVKVKWMGAISGGLCLLSFLVGTWAIKVHILFSMAGFLLFFGKDFWNNIRSTIRREQWRRKNRNNWR